jgi:hypothetical protein
MLGSAREVKSQHANIPAVSSGGRFYWLRISDLFNRYVLVSACVLPQLVDIERKGDSLDLVNRFISASDTPFPKRLRTGGGREEITAAYVHQAKAWHGVLPLLSPARREGARGAAGVDEKLVHVLEGVEAVGAAPAEDVDVETVGLGEEQVGLVADEGEALEEADAQSAMGDDLGEGQGSGLDIEAALDDLEVGGDGAEVLVCVLVGQVAQAQSLANLARGEELLELRRGEKTSNVSDRGAVWGGNDTLRGSRASATLPLPVCLVPCLVCGGRR